ncbi:MAG TPA: YdeI/OmpD-associated family protein [Candidatus Saccharimonadales bacterium]|nr:YdeI/OmpD-associated family protein [Candidatus Saccharimonadales bacterium]
MKIEFTAKLEKVGPFTIVRLPQTASDQLPSRGMAMVEGVINGQLFQAPLEPDGQKSHWLKLTDLADKTQRAIGAKVGDTVTLTIAPSEQWPEPEIPDDLQAALDNDPEAKAVWDDTTPIARWDWIRSVRSTRNPETRARRIEVACSKLRSGKPRQCCFNRSECTEPAVSKGGVLVDSEVTAG